MFKKIKITVGIVFIRPPVSVDLHIKGRMKTCVCEVDEVKPVAARYKHHSSSTQMQRPTLFYVIASLEVSERVDVLLFLFFNNKIRLPKFACKLFFRCAN